MSNTATRKGASSGTKPGWWISTTSEQQRFPGRQPVHRHRGQSNRRPDVVCFVNGLPLVVIELKNPADEKATTRSAYNQIQTYKAEIRTLFTYNEVIVISDGVESKASSFLAPWERFMPWRTVNGEDVHRLPGAQHRNPGPVACSIQPVCSTWCATSSSSRRTTARSQEDWPDITSSMLSTRPWRRPSRHRARGRPANWRGLAYAGIGQVL